MTSLPLRKAWKIAFPAIAVTALFWQAPATAQDREASMLIITPQVEIAVPKLIVPFELAKSRTIPIVQATVNGKGPFKFYFDTGAGICIFDSAFATELGLKPDGKQEVGDPSKAKQINADRYLIERLEIGSGKFSKFHALAFDRQKFGAVEEVRGVLGLPLAAHHTLSVDYVNRQIAFKTEPLDPKVPGIIKLEFSRHLTTIPLDFAGKKVLAQIDTGASTALSLPAEFVKDLPKLSEPIVVGRAKTVNNEFEIRQVQLDGTLTIAGEPFKNPVISFDDVFPVANIGYELLRDYVLSIDQRSQLVRLQRITKTPSALSIAPPKRRLGAFLTSRPDGSMEVSKVVTDTMAAKYGMKVGDIVQTIDGKSFTAQNRKALADAIATLNAIRFQILRESKPIEILIPAGSK